MLPMAHWHTAPLAIAIVCVLFPVIAAKCNCSPNAKTNRCEGKEREACPASGPEVIYIPIIVGAVFSAQQCYRWAVALRVSPQIKWRMTIIGLLLNFPLSFILIKYLLWKGFIRSAATEQPPPEIQLHAIEPGPVSGAEPQGLDPSSLQQSHKSSPEEIQVV